MVLFFLVPYVVLLVGALLLSSSKQSASGTLKGTRVGVWFGLVGLMVGGFPPSPLFLLKVLLLLTGSSLMSGVFIGSLILAFIVFWLSLGSWWVGIMLSKTAVRPRGALRQGAGFVGAYLLGGCLVAAGGYVFFGPGAVIHGALAPLHFSTWYLN